MRSAEIGSWSILVAALVGLGLGCSSGEEGDPAPPPASEPAVRAEPGPVPDFRSYVLGDLPAPSSVDRDPFVDGVEPESAPAPRVRAPRPVPAPSLRGIVRSQGRLVALLDGGSAGVGDHVGGWRVKAIDARSVTLERGRRVVRREL